MKKLIKKTAVFMAVVLVSGLAIGCVNGDDTPKDPNSEQELTVWTTYGTEKIIQDAMIYEDKMQYKELVIEAFRNEYEGGQIILTAGTDIDSYELELSDLTHTDGSTKLSKDNFNIYNQKYIRLSVIDRAVTTPDGMYPDALLPMSAAIEYGENKVESGKNQGIWLDLYTPKTQTPGEYSGEFVLTADGVDHTVPVRVTIFDFVLPTTSQVKTSYAAYQHTLAWGELDSSDEMHKTYIDYLLDYRISPQHLPGNGLSEFYDLDAFLDSAVEYTLDERCSHFNIPFNYVRGTFEDGGTGPVFVIDELIETYKAMAERSIAEGVNLFEKAGTYGIIFDEAVMRNQMNRANHNLKLLNDSQAATLLWLQENLEAEDQDFKAEVLASFARVKHKLVDSYSDELTQTAQYVPYISEYDTAEGRELYSGADYDFYGDDGELWSYHCIGPRAPHPTVHTEDLMLSARLMGWMMYNYNVVGSLFWQTTLYSWRQSSTGASLQMQDYYDKAERYPGVNGDGYLLYPGRPYGIYGPVGTIRLSALRDGFEDYELFYALESKYKELSTEYKEQSFDRLMQRLTDNLYTGTRVMRTDLLVNDFALMRRQIAYLLNAADKAGVVIEDLQALDGKFEFEISAPIGTDIYQGTTKLGGTTVNDRVIYSIEVLLTESANYLDISADNNGVIANINIYLGGKQTEYPANERLNDVTLNGAGTKTLQDITEFGYQGIKVDFGAGTDKHDIRLNVTDMAIDGSSNVLTLNLYNFGQEFAVDIRVKGSGPVYMSAQSNLSILPGANRIVIRLADFKWSTTNPMQELRLTTTNGNAVDIALGNIYC